MGGFGCLLLLVAGFQVIASQEFSQGPPPPPEWANHKCARPPPGVKDPHSCCQMTPIFTEEEMIACGIEKVDFENKQGPPRPPDCSKQECLLKSKGLLSDDNSVNRQAVSQHLDSWSVEEWKPVVETAKGFCLGENGIPGPPQICEANRLMFCVGGIIFNECPTWQDTEDCKLLKEHMDECRPPKFPPPN